MAYNEVLAARIRQALAHLTGVEEKKMFGGLAFMVNGKMCIAANKDGIMCRIGPGLHTEATARPGCKTVVMGGKQYKGYVYVAEAVLHAKKDLAFWAKLALDFNRQITGV